MHKTRVLYCDFREQIYVNALYIFTSYLVLQSAKSVILATTRQTAIILVRGQLSCLALNWNLIVDALFTLLIARQLLLITCLVALETGARRVALTELFYFLFVYKKKKMNKVSTCRLQFVIKINERNN